MSTLTFQHRVSGSTVDSIDFTSNGNILRYEPTTSTRDTVVENCKLYFTEATTAALQTKIRKIERFIDIAKRNPKGAEGVWVLYTPDTTTAWQSRLVDGELDFDQNTSFLWHRGDKIATLIIERRNYWEEQTATVIELSNNTATDGSYAPIDNCQDGSNDIYVEIDTDQITGVLLTPAILEFENTLNDATLLDDLMVGVIYGDGTSSLPTPSSLNFDDGTTADATCSNGAYAALSWADANENQIDSWTIDAGSMLQKRYRAVARLQTATAYTDLYLKCKLLSGTTIVAETRWVLVEAGESLVSIGTMQIPPYILGQFIDIGNLTLGLYEKRASGSGTLNLDFLFILPQDGWRKYGAITGLGYGETLVDDPVREVIYTDDGTSGYKVTNKIEEGEGLMLRPGVKNYMYFLQMDTDGDAPIDRTANVVVKAHARRLTV